MSDIKKGIIDNLQTANYNLWQNLLSMNALLATIFAAIATFSDLSKPSKWLIYMGLLFSTAICLYLIGNFLGVKRMYLRILRRICEHKSPSEKDVDEDMQAASLVQYLSSKAENLAIQGSFAGWIILLVVMFIRLMWN